MGKFYFAFAWDKIVNLHVRICKNKICIWSDPGVNLPICKYSPVCICVGMRHLLTPSKICTPEYIYTRVFLAHANWTLGTGHHQMYLLQTFRYNCLFQCATLSQVLEFASTVAFTVIYLFVRKMV